MVYTRYKSRKKVGEEFGRKMNQDVGGSRTSMGAQEQAAVPMCGFDGVRKSNDFRGG